MVRCRPGPHAEKYTQRSTAMHYQVYADTHTPAYVIPSSVPAHPCALCLFVLYLVPGAICYL